MAMKALLAVLAAAFVAPISGAYDLGPGSRAPSLSVRSWIKGEPVTHLDKAKTYVIEFWATWCGPCVESIPHLTEIAHKNPDVTFIGVSVWEDDLGGSIKKFVDEMGNKMDYRVAYSGNQDGMAVTWLKAASQNGIPAAFIVKNGLIRWIGHPMEIEAPLTEVKSGTFDSKKFDVTFAKKVAESKARMALEEELSATKTLFNTGKRQEAKIKLASIVSKIPDAKRQAESIQFEWLAIEDPNAWEAKATDLASSKQPSAIQQLRSYALGQASNPKGDAITARKAMELALGATEAPDPLTLQYAVLVYESLHDIKRALECNSKLLSVLPDTPKNADLRNAMEKKKAELEALEKSKR